MVSIETGDCCIWQITGPLTENRMTLSNLLYREQQRQQHTNTRAAHYFRALCGVCRWKMIKYKYVESKDHSVCSLNHRHVFILWAIFIYMSAVLMTNQRDFKPHFTLERPRRGRGRGSVCWMSGTALLEHSPVNFTVRLRKTIKDTVYKACPD